MRISFLVAASMFAVPVWAFEDGNTSDRCKPIDVMMGVHRVEPDKPDGSPKAPILPKSQHESTGPAVLIPHCKDGDTKRRKEGDYPLA